MLRFPNLCVFSVVLSVEKILDNIFAVSEFLCINPYICAGIHLIFTFMKNANLFRAILLPAIACLAVSCNDTPESPEIPDDPDKPDVPVVVEADFKFSTETVTSNSAVVVVEPKSPGD